MCGEGMLAQIAPSPKLEDRPLSIVHERVVIIPPSLEAILNKGPI
jgi:hypothetical protein